jgi:hypothetical protein
MTKQPTQAQQIAELRKQLVQVHMRVEVLASALLTVAERNGTSGWANVATLIHVAREVSERDAAYARLADAVAERVTGGRPRRLSLVE